MYIYFGKNVHVFVRKEKVKEKHSGKSKNIKRNYKVEDPMASGVKAL